MSIGKGNLNMEFSRSMSIERGRQKESDSLLRRTFASRCAEFGKCKIKMNFFQKESCLTFKIRGERSYYFMIRDRVLILAHDGAAGGPCLSTKRVGPFFFLFASTSTHTYSFAKTADTFKIYTCFLQIIFC